jgi:hypothetical protein
MSGTFVALVLRDAQLHPVAVTLRAKGMGGGNEFYSNQDWFGGGVDRHGWPRHTLPVVRLNPRAAYWLSVAADGAASVRLRTSGGAVTCTSTSKHLPEVSVAGNYSVRRDGFSPRQEKATLTLRRRSLILQALFASNDADNWLLSERECGSQGTSCDPVLHPDRRVDDLPLGVAVPSGEKRTSALIVEWWSTESARTATPYSAAWTYEFVGHPVLEYTALLSVAL